MLRRDWILVAQAFDGGNDRAAAARVLDALGAEGAETAGPVTLELDAFPAGRLAPLLGAVPFAVDGDPAALERVLARHRSAGARP